MRRVFSQPLPLVVFLTVVACSQGSPDPGPRTAAENATPTAAAAMTDPLIGLAVDASASVAARAPGNAATPLSTVSARAAAASPTAMSEPPAAAPPPDIPAPAAAAEPAPAAPGPAEPAIPAATTTPPTHAGPESGIVSVHAGVYTTAQAARGNVIQQRECAACHSPSEWTQLVASWTGQTAFQLVDHIRMTMPLMAPGSLSMQENADIVAYIFQLNNIPPGDRELSPEPAQLRNIRLERR